MPRRHFGRSNEYFRCIARSRYTIKPLIVANTNEVRTVQCPNYSVPPQIRCLLLMYDQLKPLKVLDKFYVLSASKQVQDKSSKIQHWWKYDPDCNGRIFSNESSFCHQDRVPWRFLKPRSVHTHRLRPIYLSVRKNGDTVPVVSGIRKVNNPWRDVADWPLGFHTSNGIQHLFVSQVIEGQTPPAFTIVQQRVSVFLFRGLRNGQSYAL